MATKKRASPRQMKASPRKTKPPQKPPRGAFSESDFWAIIERVKRNGRGDLEVSIETFRAELARLNDSQLQSASAYFDAAMKRACDYGLWGAAYVIHGGCSDDGFWDFRAGLVALGRKVYEAALAKPDSLAAVDDVADRTCFEGFQYVPTGLIEERGLTDKGDGQHQRPLAGKRWGDDKELAVLYPRLRKRFG